MATAFSSFLYVEDEDVNWEVTEFALRGKYVLMRAKSAREAFELLRSNEYRLILMDIQLPGINGIDATRQIHESNSEIGVLVITMFDDDDSVFAAMRAGARGYVLKGADKNEMLRAIRAVARGEALFGPGIARRLMNFFHDLDATPPTPTLATSFPELTDRERQLLELIVQGKNNAEIAEQLVISGKTVSNHISNIFSKLQVADRVQAIMRARKAGMG